jgi:hypothetical protein
MLQLAEAKVEDAVEAEMVNICSSLFKEWAVDLTFEEKQIWLWNALVEMMKIKQRRKP